MKKIFIKISLILTSLLLLRSCALLDQREVVFLNNATTSTPLSGLGAVKGVIKSQNPLDINGLIVYLGDIIQIGEEFRGGFLDPANAPHAIVNPKTGEFFINNVRPGTYSLIIYEVIAGGRAYQDESGNTLEIRVEENQILDLGTITFNLE
ncbi:hypothetical protein [Thermanaerothrix sp.]|uniref:hypothetical protein n=1 Tax=Thermanaerothrix sp. TaxID=2972675 RepID=UPI002ADDFAD8|nr:hypothetical protein [Thermanaerothrix sp.]